MKVVLRPYFLLPICAIIFSIQIIGCIPDITGSKDDGGISFEPVSGTSSDATLNSAYGYSIKVINKDENDHTFKLKYRSSLNFTVTDNLKDNPFPLKEKTYTDKLVVTVHIPNNANLVDQTDVTRVWVERDDGKKSDTIEFRTLVTGAPIYEPPVMMTGYVRYIDKTNLQGEMAKLTDWGGRAYLLDSGGNIIAETPIAGNPNNPNGMFTFSGVPKNAVFIAVEADFGIIRKVPVAQEWVWGLARFIQGKKSDRVAVPWYDNPDIQKFDLNIEVSNVNEENRTCKAVISYINGR